MALQRNMPIYIRHAFPVSENTRKQISERSANNSSLTGEPANGRMDMQELSPGLFLMHSEMSFEQETELREIYPESQVFQLSFCLNGCWAWDFQNRANSCYEISPTQCSLQWGSFTRCTSYYQSGEAYCALGITMDKSRFADLAEQLESARLICQAQKICTHVFPTTSEIRLVLRQLLDCPPERKLKKLYLEGKVLELLSLFCDEVTGKPKSDKEISKEDHRCLIKARDLIDKNFLHPLTIPQIAQQCFLSETKLKQGFKTCFNCTVYEYIVEKRLEMAYQLLQTGKYKVKDVVWMVGYSNTSHFIEAFRKRYGITPGEI